MPYKVKGKCVYKKEDNSKVGCTKGSVKKYLAALHANADVNEANTLKGGKADKLSVEDIAKKFGVSVDKIKAQIKKGINIEMEHTDNKEKATEIATDHVSEFPDYYDRLDKMEKDASSKWGKKDIKEKLRESINEAFKHNNQFLYHTTNMRNYDDIRKYGLLPQFGDTVKQAYGGYYKLDDTGDDDYDEFDYDDSDSAIKLDFDGLLFFSEYPMLGYSQTMQQKFKLNEALVCVVKKNETIYHKVSDYPKFTDYRGNEVHSIDGHTVYDLPIIIETGDWFSFDEQNPVMLLEGRYIIEFMNKNFPDELKRVMS